MKLKNIAALVALAAVAGWEIGLRPHVVRSLMMARLRSLEIEQCQASIDQLDWARLKQNPPRSLPEAEQLLGDGCRGELGALAYEFQQYLLQLEETEDGLKMEWGNGSTQ